MCFFLYFLYNNHSPKKGIIEIIHTKDKKKGFKLTGISKKSPLYSLLIRAYKYDIVIYHTNI